MYRKCCCSIYWSCLSTILWDFWWSHFMDRESEIRMGETSSCITNIQTHAACLQARTLSHDTIYPAQVLATVLNTWLSSLCLNISVMGCSCCLWGQLCLTKSPFKKNTHAHTQSLQFAYVAMPLGMGDPSSPTMGGNLRPYIRSMESQPLDCQRSA